MKIYDAKNIRNVAVLGHSGSGKTTILEAALNVAGLTNRIGKVEEGNTVSDFDEEEIKRGVSISSSMIPIEWKDSKINFIDTPGYFDFTGEVKQALSVADLGLIVVDAKGGVEVGTEKAWEYCKEQGIPVFIFVNGMDDDHVSLGNVVEELKEKFGKSIAPLQVPYIDYKDRFVGFINAIKKEGRKYVNGRTQDMDVPEELNEAVNDAHNMILEAVAETSDESMEKYFSEEPFTVEEIQEGLRIGLTDGSLTPVICGTAIYNIGIRVLLNSIVTFVPDAYRIGPEITVKKYDSEEEVVIKNENDEPLTAFVFKTIADPYVGRLNLFRVYSGILKKDSLVYNPRTHSMEKIGAISIMRGKSLIPISEVRAGDIGAVAKMNNILTGDTLCQENNPISLRVIDYPKAHLSYAVYPKGKGEEDKLASSIARLLEEDKTLRFGINSDTRESILSGTGDNQIDISVSKLKNRYKIDVELRDPKVPYREFIKGKSKIQNRYRKQSGGHGQYGDVHIEYEPSGDLSVPYIFVEKIFGGSVPRQYFSAVEKGIEESIFEGPLAGYPVMGLKATLVDGSYHPVDSSEMAFKTASSQAFREGFMKAQPGILEPIQKVTVYVPDEYMGDIMGDITKRRGRILGMGESKGYQVIDAEVPAAEMFKYVNDLRSMTQGRGSFDMEFLRYDEATKDMQEKVIKEALEKNK